MITLIHSISFLMPHKLNMLLVTSVTCHTHKPNSLITGAYLEWPVLAHEPVWGKLIPFVHSDYEDPNMVWLGQHEQKSPLDNNSKHKIPSPYEENDPHKLCWTFSPVTKDFNWQTQMWIKLLRLWRSTQWEKMFSDEYDLMYQHLQVDSDWLPI